MTRIFKILFDFMRFHPIYAVKTFVFVMAFIIIIILIISSANEPFA